MTVLDSSVWIAYLNADDSQHQKAVRVFSDIDGQLLLPEYVVLEVYTVLVTRVGKKEANAFLDVCVNNKGIRILLTDESFFLGVVDACQKQPRNGLSFADVALIALSKTHRVITFDALLQKSLMS